VQQQLCLKKFLLQVPGSWPIIQDTLLKKVSGIKTQATSYKRSRYKLILLKSQANGSGTTVQDTSDNI
jgi:hypothetical protein